MERPYPYNRWPKLSRQEVILIRNCIRQLPQIDHSALISITKKFLGAPLIAIPGSVEYCTSEMLQDRTNGPMVAAILERGSGGSKNRIIACFSLNFTAAIVDRTLGGEGDFSIGKNLLPLDDLSKGVFAYAIARLLQEFQGDFLLNDIVTDNEQVRTLLGNIGIIIWPIRVDLADHSSTARIFFPAEGINPYPSQDKPSLFHSILGMHMTLAAEIGHTRLQKTDAEHAQCGDVVLLDECGLYREKNRWLGSANLHLLGARRTIWHCSIQDQELHIDSIINNQEMKMGKGQTQVLRDPIELVQLASDVPLEITVELARFTIPLEELSQLRIGEVLITDRPVGECVTLRAGGQAFATGELIDVDGQVGVRILATGT